MYFIYINNKKHIQNGIGPLKDSSGNLVTDDQSMASILNKYFSSNFNTTSGAENINTNDFNINDVTNSVLVDSQDATIELNSNSNGSVSNNTENPHGLDQQNCIHDHVINSEHTLQNFEITTEDVLNTINNMKTNKKPQTRQYLSYYS